MSKAEQQRQTALKSLDFSQSWIDQNQEWITQTDYALSKMQMYMHRMGNLSSPHICDHLPSSVGTHFPVNPELLPDRPAGAIHAEWSRHQIASMMVRPQMLEVLDLLKKLSTKHHRRLKNLLSKEEKNEQHDDFFAINGSAGSGKSCLLNYISMFARQENWLTVFIPGAQTVDKTPFRIYKATDRPEVFYQPDLAKQFFEALLRESSDVLARIHLKCDYSADRESENQPLPDGSEVQEVQQAEANLQESEGNSDSPELEEGEQAQAEAEAGPETTYRELTPSEYAAIKEIGDVTVKNVTEDVETLDQALEKLREANMLNGRTNFVVEKSTGASSEKGGKTLKDLVLHGAGDECPNPAALLYDFVEELKLVDEVPVLFAVDCVNAWDGISQKYTDHKLQKLEFYQLSFVDAFMGLQARNQLKNGLSFMATTSIFPLRDSNELLKNCSKVIEVPSEFTFDEFDSQLEHYKSASIYERDTEYHRRRIEGLSSRVPREVYKYCELY